LTLREYRKGDWAGVVDLWRNNPSDEYPLIGLDSDALGRVLRKVEGVGIRFVLGFTRLLRRPVLIVLIVDIGGRVVGTTLVSFSAESAYVGGVVVDTSVRRQGHAREMLRAADDLARKYHRSYVVLDVLAQNTPALRLYDRLGYQPLRDQVWLARTLSPEMPLPALSGTTRLRPFGPSDGPVLAELDNALMPAQVRSIVPRHRRDFQASGFSRSILQSDIASWVAEVDGRPVGFLQATVSRLMQAGNLSAPVVGAGVPESVARDLLLAALHWSESHHAPRVLTSLPDHQWQRRPLLESLGFVEHFRVHTLVHRLGA
jgi:GNAT superfamily N-acetyltransferase